MLQRDHAIELLKRDHEIELLRREIVFLEADALSAKGLLTSRGIFEHALTTVHKEMGLRGHFNASSTIQNMFSPVQVVGKAKELLDIYRKCCPTQVDSLHSDAQKFYLDLYSVLSSEIHGYPWSGPGVVVHAHLSLHPGAECVITGLASRLSLDVVKKASASSAAIAMPDSPRSS